MAAKTEPDFVSLVPELADWNDGGGIDIDSWICCVGDYTHAIGYGRLFWPPFLEHDDAVFFANGFSENSYRGFMDRTGGDRRAVEVVMNHRHLLNLFGDRTLSPSAEQLQHVADLLSQTWLAKLQRDFPGRGFSVYVTGLDAADLLHAEITFRQL